MKAYNDLLISQTHKNLSIQLNQKYFEEKALGAEGCKQIKNFLREYPKFKH